MKSKIILIVVAQLIFCTSIFSLSHAKDAGLVTYITGNVYYGAGADKQKAVTFMKAKIGDVFYLDENATLHLVYFKNSRKEKWEGNVEILINENGGEVPPSFAEKAEPKVDTISDKTKEGLREIPSFIQNINTERTGSGVLRGAADKEYREYAELSAKEKQAVKETRLLYDEMAKISAADDITPELFAIGVLSQYQLYKETLGIVNEALKKQPANDGLKQMREKLEIIVE